MARQQRQPTVETTIAAEPEKTLFDLVAGHLDAKDWNYTAYEDKGYISTSCRLKEGSVRVTVDVYESKEWQRVLVFSSFPVYVPEYRCAAVAETLTRVNYKTAFGNLEMDFTDGEVRVRTSVEAESGMSEPMIERVLNGNFDTADRFFAPILAIAFGNAVPETVFDLAEKRGDATLQ